MKFSNLLSSSKNKTIKESLSYSYFIPEDRETQLYDFYLISLYYQVIKNGYNAKSVAMSHIDGDTLLDLEIIIDDAINKIVAVQKRDLLNATFTAISSEFRHGYNGLANAGDNWSISASRDALLQIADETGINKNRLLKTLSYYDSMKGEPEKHFSDKLSKKYMIGSNPERDEFRQAIQLSKMDHLEFVKLALKSFNYLRWEDGFGGKPWAKIAQGWIDLNNSKTIDQSIQSIDHIYDLEHNNNVMLDKVKDFAKYKQYSHEDKKKYQIIGLRGDAEYVWIKKALDLKFNASVWQLAKKSSLPKRIIGMLNRITGVENIAYDEFARKSKEDKKEKIKSSKHTYIEEDYSKALFKRLIKTFDKEGTNYQFSRNSKESLEQIMYAYNNSKTFNIKINVISSQNNKRIVKIQDINTERLKVFNFHVYNINSIANYIIKLSRQI